MSEYFKPINGSDEGIDFIIPVIYNEEDTKHFIGDREIGVHDSHCCYPMDDYEEDFKMTCRYGNPKCPYELSGKTFKEYNREERI